MQHKMIIEQPPNGAGVILTIFLGIWSWLLGAVTTVDVIMLPLLHFFQILVALCGIAAFIFTMKPSLKSKLFKTIGKWFSKE